MVAPHPLRVSVGFSDKAPTVDQVVEMKRLDEITSIKTFSKRISKRRQKKPDHADSGVLRLTFIMTPSVSSISPPPALEGISDCLCPSLGVRYRSYPICLNL